MPQNATFSSLNSALILKKAWKFKFWTFFYQGNANEPLSIKYWRLFIAYYDYIWGMQNFLLIVIAFFL